MISPFVNKLFPPTVIDSHARSGFRGLALPAQSEASRGRPENRGVRLLCHSSHQPRERMSASPAGMVRRQQGGALIGGPESYILVHACLGGCRTHVVLQYKLVAGRSQSFNLHCLCLTVPAVWLSRQLQSHGPGSPPLP